MNKQQKSQSRAFGDALIDAYNANVNGMEPVYVLNTIAAFTMLVIKKLLKEKNVENMKGLVAVYADDLKRHTETFIKNKYPATNQTNQNLAQ